MVVVDELLAVFRRIFLSEYDHYHIVDVLINHRAQLVHSWRSAQSGSALA